MTNRGRNSPVLPAEIVFSPQWWFKNERISFDEDFFFHPSQRVEAEQTMEKALYNRWGKYGLGKHKNRKLPFIGAVHQAAGFMLSEMLGCRVEYKESAPPEVIPACRQDLNLSTRDAFTSTVYKRFEHLIEELKEKFGYVTGDVNWGGILNLALDVRGQSLFLDINDRPSEVKKFFAVINDVIEKFTGEVYRQTGTTSISVNRNVHNIKDPVFLHSECTNTMISVDSYETFLFRHDARWSKMFTPFGIHHCGSDAHRYAETFSKLPRLDFLDVGWGSDITILRKHLPETFLNIRLSPVEMIENTPAEIEATIRSLVADSGDLRRTGICCINMDEKVSDEKVTALFDTVEQLRT